MKISATFKVMLAVLITIPALSGSAFAYVGPGAGLTLVGALWAVIVAVVLAIGAVLLWPIRMMRKKLREAKKEKESGGPDTTPKV